MDKGLTAAGAPRKRAEGAGRPPGTGFQPTEEQRRTVQVMASLGIPEDKMVLAVINPQTSKPISPVTLRAHFRAELDNGFVSANALVGAALFKNATTATKTYPGGNPTCQIFWSKTRMRWKSDGSGHLPGDIDPAAQQKVDIREDAKRIAFALALGVAELERAETAVPAKPQTKRRAA